jgi:hypothetical protein
MPRRREMRTMRKMRRATKTKKARTSEKAKARARVPPTTTYSICPRRGRKPSRTEHLVWSQSYDF